MTLGAKQNLNKYKKGNFEEDAVQSDMGIAKNQEYLFGGPYNNDYSILGSLGNYYHT